MKLLVRGTKALAIVDPSSSLVLSPGESLLDFPEEVALSDMDEGFVAALRAEGLQGARAYTSTLTYPTTISMWEFRQRFTFTQRATIEAGRAADPIIETLMRDLESVRDNLVDLSLGDTVQGVGVLVQAGFITPSRAAYVLHYGDDPAPTPDDTPVVEDPPPEDPPVEP